MSITTECSARSTATSSPAFPFGETNRLETVLGLNPSERNALGVRLPLSPPTGGIRIGEESGWKPDGHALP